MKKIQYWEDNIASIMNLEFDQTMIDAFIQNKQIEAQTWADILWENKEIEFMRNYLLDEAMGQYNVVKQIYRSDLPEITCIISKNTQYDILSNNPHITQAVVISDCYMNAFIVAMDSPRMQIVYGIAEGPDHLPRFHAWNKIDGIYLDYTWELYLELGSHYWPLKVFDQDEFYWKIKHQHSRQKLKWHNYLMQDIDRIRSKQIYSEYLQKFALFKQERYKEL